MGDLSDFKHGRRVMIWGIVIRKWFISENVTAWQSFIQLTQGISKLSCKLFRGFDGCLAPSSRSYTSGSNNYSVCHFANFFGLLGSTDPKSHTDRRGGVITHAVN